VRSSALTAPSESLRRGRASSKHGPILSCLVEREAGNDERCALLQAAAELADEAVDVDHQPILARAHAGRPRAHVALPEPRVELADMPERERAQERRKRRRAGIQPPSSRPVRPARSTPPSSMLSAPSAIANSSAITLPARVGGPGPVAGAAARDSSANASIPSRSARVATGVADDALIVELDLHAVRPIDLSPCTMKMTS
jgi:hypothetical protein